MYQKTRWGQVVLEIAHIMGPTDRKTIISLISLDVLIKQKATKIQCLSQRRPGVCGYIYMLNFYGPAKLRMISPNRTLEPKLIGIIFLQAIRPRWGQNLSAGGWAIMESA